MTVSPTIEKIGKRENEVSVHNTIVRLFVRAKSWEMSGGVSV
jgi:hypothetical protein